ncbi:hypothetical protein [Sulfitobacter sp. JB4-11]|uniref:hypothetical protein n=1 Tax=Sulfitobacter rhodophyticola TaxID=3238304 RepID=UPI0035175F59
MPDAQLKTRQIIAPLIMGVAVYLLFNGLGTGSAPLAALAGLAVAIHMINNTLRELVFRELVAQSAVGPKDLFARCCWVVFDAILLFGIVTAAGLQLAWPVFTGFATGLAVILPLAMLYVTRNARAPESSQPGFPVDYWAPPAFLLLMAILLYVAQTMVMSGGSQPFVHLVLLSTIGAINRSGGRLEGRAMTAGLVSVAATIVLLGANYLQIT